MNQEFPVPGVVRCWVEESCAAQAVAVKVTDSEAVGRVAALLREGRHAPRPDVSPPGQVDP